MPWWLTTTAWVISVAEYAYRAHKAMQEQSGHREPSRCFLIDALWFYRLKVYSNVKLLLASKWSGMGDVRPQGISAVPFREVCVCEFHQFRGYAIYETPFSHTCSNQLSYHVHDLDMARARTVNLEITKSIAIKLLHVSLKDIGGILM